MSRRTLTHPDVVWGLWCGATVASFAVLENRALQKHEGGHTLTAALKRWLGVHPNQPAHRAVGAVALAAAAVWFAVHIYAPDDQHPGCVWCA